MIANFKFIFICHFSINFERFGAYPAAYELKFPKHTNFFPFWWILEELWPYLLRSHYFLTHPVYPRCQKWTTFLSSLHNFVLSTFGVSIVLLVYSSIHPCGLTNAMSLPDCTIKRTTSCNCMILLLWAELGIRNLTSEYVSPIHPFRFCFLWVCLEHTICHQHCGTELEEGEEIISRPSSMGLGCPSRRLELRCESPRGRSTYQDIGATIL